MAVITMKQLLEAGVHFGHQTRKWNPKMKKYIFAARNDIHIIDLQVTANLIEEAYAFVCESVKDAVWKQENNAKQKAKHSFPHNRSHT